MGDLHVLIGLTVRHRQIVGVIIQRMNVQAIFFRTTGELSKNVGDVLLLINRQVVLRLAEEDDASFADRYGQVAQLFF